LIPTRDTFSVKMNRPSKKEDFFGKPRSEHEQRFLSKILHH
jgi:hypothetical protein